MNLWKIVLLVTILFSLPTLFAFDVDPIGKNVKEGVERYKAQNYQGSLDSFNQAESQGKEEDRLYFNKGTSYYKLKDYKLALKYFEKSATSEDKDLKLRSLYNKGNTYAKLGDKKNAIKSYMDALSANPDFLPARKNLEMLVSGNVRKNLYTTKPILTKEMHDEIKTLKHNTMAYVRLDVKVGKKRKST